MKRKEEHSRAHRKNHYRGARHHPRAYLKKSAWKQMLQRCTAL